MNKFTINSCTLYYFLIITYVVCFIKTQENNNKCYSFYKVILICSNVDTSATDLGQFLTKETAILTINDSHAIFGPNYHANGEYKTLKRYSIVRSKSLSVVKGAFLGLDNVINMEIYGNKWSEISDNIFIGLTNLEQLNLTNNKIEKLSLNSLRDVHKMVILDLSSNLIDNIPSYVFQDLSMLRDLHLEQNNIKQIQRNAFHGLPELDKLILSHNFIRRINTEELNGLKNLRILNLDFNEIEDIYGKFIMPKLKFLQLNNNKLSVLLTDTFSNCESLLSIDLSDNALKSLTEVPFQHLSQLTHLNLYKNEVNISKFENLQKNTLIIFN